MECPVLKLYPCAMDPSPTPATGQLMVDLDRIGLHDAICTPRGPSPTSNLQQTPLAFLYASGPPASVVENNLASALASSRDLPNLDRET